MKLSGSLWLAVIVGTKAVDHSYLDGFSIRCLVKLDKRAPLCRKNAGNFSLLAPKLLRFFFCAHKTQLKRFTIA